MATNNYGKTVPEGKQGDNVPFKTGGGKGKTSSRGRGKSRGNQTRNTSGTATNIPEKLKKDIGSFNWLRPIGTPISAGNWINSVPSVMGIKMYPTMGLAHPTQGVNSPANQMARMVFNKVIGINATSAPYDPVDLQMGIYAMSELHKFTMWAKRVYEYTSAYSIYNRSIPEAFFMVEGINKDDIINSLSDYRSWYNNFIIQCATLCCPGNIPFMQENEMLFKGVYCDENSSRAQMTVFTPYVFYKYNELTDKGTALFPIMPGYESAYSEAEMMKENAIYNDNWSPTHTAFKARKDITFKDIVKIGEDLLKPLLYSEDIMRMSADISRAYDANALIKFESLDESDTLPILYSEDMNMIIENMRLAGTFKIDTTRLDLDSAADGHTLRFCPPIKQNPGINGFAYSYLWLSTTSIFGKSNEFAESDEIFNVHDDRDVSPDDMINMTRFYPVLHYEPASGTKGAFCIASAGLNVPMDMTVIAYSGYDKKLMRYYFGSNSWMLKQDATLSSTFNQMMLLSAFAVHPRLTVTTDDANMPMRDIIHFDKYAVVPKRDIQDIHVAFITTQFLVPDFNYPIDL